MLTTSTPAPARTGRRGARLLLTALTVAAVAGGGLVATGAADAADAATAVPATVSDASFTWGLSDQANIFQYGQCNFLSAGTAGDNGISVPWTTQAPTPAYQAADGNVSILRPDTSGALVPVPGTLSTTCADASGAPLASGASHTVVKFSHGTGTVDAADGTASISWTGSFTSVFYNGLVYWSAANPKLTVAHGVGTLTATVSAHAPSGRTSGGPLTTIDPTTATLATFSNARVTDSGFTVTPDFAGVVDTSATTTQKQSATGWGSWPQSFITFANPVGIAPFFYTSSTSDPQLVKAPLPISFAYTAVHPTLTATAPTISGTAKVGVKLTAKVGTWGPVAVTKKLQWYASGKAITGATKSTFVPAAAQFGKTITVKVTGTVAGYPTLVTTTKATKKVAAGALRTVTPKITGTAKVGKKLTAHASSTAWTSGTKISYQWFAGTKAIKGATKSTLTLKAAQKGKTIKVKVTGKRTGYVTTAKVSKTTKKVAAK